MIPCPEELAEAVAAELKPLGIVEYAEVEEEVVPAAVHFGDDRLANRPRGHLLGAAAGGIDAIYTWTVPGGDGSRVSLVVIDFGFNLDHEDLRDTRVVVDFAGEQSATSLNHASGALGVILASDNGVGGVGIAPRVQCFAAAAKTSREVTMAIVVGATRVGPGGVMLLEVALKNGRPLEWWGPHFEAIQLATFIGVTVIEPAGNSYDVNDLPRAGVDLDAPAELSRLMRGNHVSGAVMVAAADPGVGSPRWTRVLNSAFGSRIDCFARGVDIPIPLVSGPPGVLYGTFGETSGRRRSLPGRRSR